MTHKEMIIKELRKALNKTTKGTWRLRRHPNGEDAFVEAPEPKDRKFGYDIEVFGDDHNGYETWRDDFEFAVMAHELLPILLDYIEKGEEGIKI